MRRRLKELLEEVAEVERDLWCEKTGEVTNGYYTRGLETVCGKIKDLKVPRTRGGEFRPFFMEPRGV